MGIACSVKGSMIDWSMNAKQKKKIRNLVLLYFAAIAVICSIPVFGHAADGNNDLMDIFTTTAFTGSWEVFSKFNWLGKAVNFLISAFCLIGISLTVVRFTVTLLYKSNETLGDRIYEIKSKGKGQRFFGVITMGREVFNGNYGTGADAIIGFGLALLPNIKAYSDYNPEKMAYNLSEDDTITTYVLKISIPTIMTLFFFSTGFSGVLWQAFGNVVNAMSQVAKKGVEVNLAGYVNKALNAGAYYQFSFNTADELGKLQKSIATSVYNKILLRMESYDTTTMQNVGGKIEQWVVEKFSATRLDMLNTAKGAKKISEDVSAADNLSFQTCINSSSELGAESNSCYAVVTDLAYFGVSGTSTKQYIHVYVNKKANADETDYFKPKKGTAATAAPESMDKSLE